MTALAKHMPGDEAVYYSLPSAGANIYRKSFNDHDSTKGLFPLILFIVSTVHLEEAGLDKENFLPYIGPIENYASIFGILETYATCCIAVNPYLT